MGILFRFLRPYYRTLAIGLVLAAANQFFSLLDPQIFRLIVDRYATRVAELEQSTFLSGVLFLLLASIGVAFASRVAKSFQDYYVNVVTQRVGTALYASAVAHSFSLPYAAFEDQRSGELLRTMEKARADAQTLIANAVNSIFFSLIGIVFVLVYAFTVNYLVGIFYFLLIPALGTTAFFISRSIKGVQQKIVKETVELAGTTTETIRNVEMVKSLGLEGQEIKRLNDVNERILALELKKVKLIRIMSFIQGTTINAMRSALLLLMLWLVFSKSITIGEFFSLFIYSFYIFQPLGEFGNIAAQYQEAKTSMERLDSVLKTPVEEKPALPQTIGSLSEISFTRAGFSYANSVFPAVEDISLVLRGGETIAFVGPSGSGKTTLVKLILGLYRPSTGALMYNSVSADEIDYEALRRRIGFVAQETQLFAGTIRDNLLFVRPEASDADCLKALELAAGKGILERAEKGLDTKIGEGGIKLSGGERQRLAIARALLRNPDLLVFDEATSSLDSLTEKSITATIREIDRENPNLMVVLVAHRLSTVMHAKRIYVLERGRIVEHGSHATLLHAKGLYAAMWREQAGGASDPGIVDGRLATSAH